MKKAIKSIAALFVVLTLCVGLLAGCSGGSPAGTWKLTGGEVMGSSVGSDQLGDTSSSTLVLKEDGSVEGGGTWKLEGSTLKISENGMSLDCEYNGSNIIVNMGFMKMIYSRA